MSANPDGAPPDFSSWAPVVEAAIEFANGYPDDFRGAIVQALLVGAPPPERAPAEPVSGVGAAPSSPAFEADGQAALARLGEELEADPSVLRRVVDIDPEKNVRILVRLENTSTAHLQNQYSAIHAFVCEFALGAQDTSGEVLREVCKRHRCYDKPNFTRNFRATGWLNEVTNTRRNKRYRLSREGEREVRHLLRELLEN